MSDDSTTQAAPRETAEDAAPPTDMGHDRSVEAIKKDVEKAIKNIKTHFGLLLELRDRRIVQLEAKLSKGTREAAKCRLLVVDDAGSTHDIMKRYLEGQPVEVICVNGDRAREQVGADNYETVMIEASVAVGPDADGMALCRELCEKGKGERVIMMSSRPGNTIKNAAKTLGAGFLRKPFGRVKLAKLVRDASQGGQQ